MKTIFNLVLTLACTACFAQQVIDSSYLRRTENFKVVKIGDTLLFTTGGLAIIDSSQLRAMQDIVNFVLSGELDSAIVMTIADSERKIKECDQIVQDLLANCQRESDLTQRIMDSTERHLARVNRSLSLMQEDLQSANRLMDESLVLLRKNKWPKIWQGVAIGLSGVIIGLMIR